MKTKKSRNEWRRASAQRKPMAGDGVGRPERAFIYGRVACVTKPGDVGRRQLRACRRYAARKGFALVGHAIDAPASGLSNDRPGFAALIAVVTNGGVDVVLVQDLDRISRSAATIDYLMKSAAKSSVRVIETGRDDDEWEE